MDKQGDIRTLNLDQLISREGDQLELKIKNETDEDADARRARDSADVRLAHHWHGIHRLHRGRPVRIAGGQKMGL